MHTSPAKLARTVDSAWSMRLTDGPRLTRALDELRRSGRDGIERMEVIIDERGPDWIPPESGLEHRFHALLRDDGQAPMRLQVGIGDDTFIGRVDALDDDASVIVEIQSNRFHRSPTDVAADAIRRGRLEAQGYLVIEVWEDEIFHDPGPALARIRRARSRRAA